MVWGNHARKFYLHDLQSMVADPDRNENSSNSNIKIVDI
jgi:hypothetical protein